jgi:hypothetical protein
MKLNKFPTSEFCQNLTKIFKVPLLLLPPKDVFIIYLLKFKKIQWINFQIE